MARATVKEMAEIRDRAFLNPDFHPEGCHTAAVTLHAALNKLLAEIDALTIENAELTKAVAEARSHCFCTAGWMDTNKTCRELPQVPKHRWCPSCLWQAKYGAAKP